MSAIKYLLVTLCIGGACSLQWPQSPSVGRPCTLRVTQAKGTCTLFKDCNKARENLKHRIFPQLCGFQGRHSIVCCETIQEKQFVPRKPGDISKIKCKEYSKYVKERKILPILLINAPTVVKDECGHKVVKLILGGEPAAKKEFPHMAAIGYDAPGKIEWNCGGTMISDLYILTAGHCLSYMNKPAKYIKIGVINLKSTSHHEQEFTVAGRMRHPLYRPPSHYNDIGLIKLNRPVKMNPFARPACLHFNEEINAESAIATGWGVTEKHVPSEDLLKVTLELFNHSDCNHFYKNIQSKRKLKDGIMDDGQLCAGFKDGKRDACQGDSGGPLQIYHVGDKIKCMYDIIGVTSFGKACGAKIGVYSRISHYIKWIEDTVWP